jgi:probable rRNA maturation factor
MIEVVNRQRKTSVNVKFWQQFAAFAANKIIETDGKFLTLAFVSDRKMRELNHQFRGKNSTTDVLSFPFEADEFETDENTLGDIVISVEQAARQAAENNLNFETEIKQLILHGILHLCGYDHENDDGEMNARELRLRDELGI